MEQGVGDHREVEAEAEAGLCGHAWRGVWHQACGPSLTSTITKPWLVPKYSPHRRPQEDPAAALQDEVS